MTSVTISNLQQVIDPSGRGMRGFHQSYEVRNAVMWFSQAFAPIPSSELYIRLEFITSAEAVP
jgi:hypothetical protein